MGDGQGRAGFEEKWQLLKVLTEEIMSHELWEWLRKMPRKGCVGSRRLAMVLPSAKSELTVAPTRHQRTVK